MIFETIQNDPFEQIIFCQDLRVGLRAIIAIHSLALGPATGGCRMWNYASEAQALEDVTRLAKGMTYKAAISGLKWGGAKAVILGDHRTQKTPNLLSRFGEFVDRLNGHYVTAKDVGIDCADLRVMKRKSAHVLGIEGEPGSSGDPSPATAWGVYHGMLACAQHVYKIRSLRGLTIALQGLGAVSDALIPTLLKEGAQIIGCDVDTEIATHCQKKYGIQLVAPDTIFDTRCDIFSPSALGASINPSTIGRLKAKIVAGAANNQLATSEDGHFMAERGIIYAPDYTINAGGVINIYHESREFSHYDAQRAYDHVALIEHTILNILERAVAEHVPPHLVADRIAEERVERARQEHAVH